MKALITLQEVASSNYLALNISNSNYTSSLPYQELIFFHNFNSENKNEETSLRLSQDFGKVYLLLENSNNWQKYLNSLSISLRTPKFTSFSFIKRAKK